MQGEAFWGLKNPENPGTSGDTVPWTQPGTPPHYDAPPATLASLYLDINSFYSAPRSNKSCTCALWDCRKDKIYHTMHLFFLFNPTMHQICDILLFMINLMAETCKESSFYFSFLAVAGVQHSQFSPPNKLTLCTGVNCNFESQSAAYPHPLVAPSFWKVWLLSCAVVSH